MPMCRFHPLLGACFFWPPSPNMEVTALPALPNAFPTLPAPSTTPLPMPLAPSTKPLPAAPPTPVTALPTEPAPSAKPLVRACPAPVMPCATVPTRVCGVLATGEAPVGTGAIMDVTAGWLRASGLRAMPLPCSGALLAPAAGSVVTKSSIVGCAASASGCSSACSGSWLAPAPASFERPPLRCIALPMPPKAPAAPLPMCPSASAVPLPAAETPCVTALPVPVTTPAAPLPT
mmetsp:Transcript_26265/g.66005  ORF Transcript_26265/g.66005 Transcript_26265/m.66005 type:complete len:233 (-) Transcript_26265:1467-2165(-)